MLLLAQINSTKDLEGKVYSKDGDVAATHVLNTTSKRATITDVNGFFSIPVRLNDTLVFSAVQFKKKEIVVTLSIYESTQLRVPLEDILTVLDEVVVTPYNLSGDITKDLLTLDLEPVVTAGTLGLPNANVRVITKAERELFEATSGGGLVPITPILNAISGRRKCLNSGWHAISCITEHSVYENFTQIHFSVLPFIYQKARPQIFFITARQTLLFSPL